MNSTEAVTTVRRVGQLSANDPVYDASALLSELTQALMDRFAEPMTNLRQGYGLHHSTTSTTAGTSWVRIPPRAVVQGLEKLEVSIDGGEEYFGLIAMTQIQAQDFSPTRQDIPTHYTLEGDTVRLWPIPNGAYTVKFTYYLRHPQLITYAATGLVTSVSGQDVVTATNPSTFSITTSTGCDIQNADGSRELAVVGGTIADITGAGPYTITFSSSVDLSRVRVGDYIRFPDQCVFPMLVPELERPWCDYTAAMIWLSKGDSQKAAALSQKADSGIRRVVSMAQPRNKTGQFIYKRKNSYLRRNLGWW